MKWQVYPARPPERSVLKAASGGTLDTFPHFMSNIPNIFVFVFFHKRHLLKKFQENEIQSHPLSFTTDFSLNLKVTAEIEIILVRITITDLKYNLCIRDIKM